MKTRGVAILMALLLALGATAAVFMYVQSVRKSAVSPGSVKVIVPKRDIPAGTRLDTLISSGAFTTVSVPRDALVLGAVTDLTQLQGRTTSAAVIAGEQITTARLSGAGDRTGGPLGIREGYQAVGVTLPAPQAGLGFVRPGDHVTLYATFSDVKLIRGDLRALAGGRAASVEEKLGDFTLTVAPEVRVLKIVSTGASSVSGGTTADISMSLELTPEEAERVIFAREKGSLWMGLLPPEQEGETKRPIHVGDLLLFSVRNAA